MELTLHERSFNSLKIGPIMNEYTVCLSIYRIEYIYKNKTLFTVQILYVYSLCTWRVLYRKKFTAEKCHFFRIACSRHFACCPACNDLKPEPTSSCSARRGQNGGKDDVSQVSFDIFKVRSISLEFHKTYSRLIHYIQG